MLRITPPSDATIIAGYTKQIQCPVRNAPSKDPVVLASCLKQVAVAAGVGVGSCYASMDFSRQCMVRNAVVSALVSWYGQDQCPSLQYLGNSMHNRLMNYNASFQAWLVAPVMFLMPPKQWPSY